MMAGPNAADERLRRLSGLLLDGELDESSVDDVVTAGLAGYALHRVSTGTAGEATEARSVARDPRLQRGRLLASVKHKAIRPLIIELVRAWREAGIETLLYKGFMLAEYVYPDPTWRAYSDVDVALRAADGVTDAELAAAAAEVSRAAGWDVIWRHGEPHHANAHHDAAYNGHELLLLHHPERGVNLDAHRRLVHSNVSSRSRSSKAEEITRQVWSAAEERELDGTKVLIPAAADSALVGLIAGRSWSGDRYEIRPHDPLDLQTLYESGGLDSDHLLRRARELGMERTARLFLRRCDPAAGVLDLRKPSGLEVFGFDTLLMPERGHRSLQRFAHEVASFSALSLDTALAVWGALRSPAAPSVGVDHRRAGPSAPAATDGPEQAAYANAAEVATGPAENVATEPLDRLTWRRSQTAVRRALRLLGTTPKWERSLTLELLAASLLRRGHRVRLVESAGRAWLEDDGRPLWPAHLPGVVTGSEAETDLPGWPIDPLAERGSTTFPRRLARIGWRGLMLRAEAFVRLTDIRRRLRSATFKEVRASVLKPLPAEAAPSETVTALEIGQAVESAARFVPGALCLAQSLGAQVMLTRRGLPSTIHVGFLRAEAGQVEGHAWLEADGQVVTGDVGLESFTRTATFEVPGVARNAS